MANDVELKVGADTKSAEKTLDQFKENSTKNLSAIEKSFGHLKTAATAAVAVFAAKNVFDFFKGGISAAAEAEVAFAKMNKALQLSGNAAPGVADTFVQLATNIERVTGVSEEAIQEQIGVAQAFGLTNAETQKLIIAATELSAATGNDLNTSVKMLGNSFNGTLGPLKKLVPELQAMDESALHAGQQLDFIIDRFGGSAAENLKTFTGAVEQVGIAFGKIPEAFGEAVIQNEALRKALETITNVFYGLADIVKSNQGGISSLVTFALDPLMGALSAGVRIIGFFNNAINGWQITFAGIGKVVLDVIAKLREWDVLVTKLTGSDTQYENAKKASEQAEKAATEYTKALILMNEQLIKEKKDFSALNDSILNYKTAANNATKSLNALAIAESGANRGRATTAKDLEALKSAYENLYDKIVSESLNARDKELGAYQKYLKELDRLMESGQLDQEKLNKLSETLYKTHQKNLTEIAAKETEARQKEIEKIVNDTNVFQQIKIVLDPKSASDVKEAIAKTLKAQAFEVGASAIGAVSNGAQGADAVAAFVSTFVSKVPWIGGMIAELVKLAGMAPDKNKEAIQGFTKGIPEFLSNINTNMGSLTEILNEVIGPVIEKVLTSSGLGNMFMNWMKNIIKLPELIGTIATGVYKGLKSSGGELKEAVRVGVSDVKNEMGRFSENVRNFFSTFYNQLRGAFAYVLADNPILNELKSLKVAVAVVKTVIEFLVKAVQTIPVALIQIRDLVTGIGTKLGESFTNLGDKLTDGFIQIRDTFTSLFDGVVTAIRELPDQIKTAFSGLYDGIKNAIAEAFSSFFETFNNMNEKLGNIAGGSGKVSGGSGKDPVSEALGLATGISEVPRGYPNDTFAARLSSGERVIDTSTNGDLKRFLAEAQGGGLGSGEALSLLRQIASSRGQGIPSVVQVVIDKKVLGSTILDMNRRNERING